MPSQSTTTTDHDEIREWVEQHDGKPACVRGTGSGRDIGILRIDFPGGAGEDELKHVSGISGSRSSMPAAWRFSTRTKRPTATTAPSSSW